ncbi:MAG: hypothetical protein KFF50_10950, partial [Desulfatitalea sp.]|nr:hypothetical protein [Desulfatitalea sp.]
VGHCGGSMMGGCKHRNIAPVSGNAKHQCVNIRHFPAGALVSRAKHRSATVGSTIFALIHGVLKYFQKGFSENGMRFQITWAAIQNRKYLYT